jgi:hypothetical protein
MNATPPVALEAQIGHSKVMSSERDIAALRHFQAIGAGKAASHRLAQEEAAVMDPLERIVRGLALARVWADLVPGSAESKAIIPLHTLLAPHRSKSRSSDRS